MTKQRVLRRKSRLSKNERFTMMWGGQGSARLHAFVENSRTDARRDGALDQSHLPSIILQSSFSKLLCQKIVFNLPASLLEELRHEYMMLSTCNSFVLHDVPPDAEHSTNFEGSQLGRTPASNYMIYKQFV